MKYNFNTVDDHRNDLSYRWAQPYGRTDVLGMDTADLDFRCPSFIQDATKEIWERNTFNYRGIPSSYYEAICSWYASNYGMTVDSSWLSSAPGTIGAIRIAIETFVGTGQKIIMQSPYFSPLRRAVEGSGNYFVENPMVARDGRYELDLKDFEEKVISEKPKAFLLVNPQNPTGRVFSRPELDALVEICHRHKVIVISDEVHSLITYQGNHHTPLFNVSDKAREIGILVTSVSKAFNLMGLPHGIVMIADKDMKSRWDDTIASYSFSYAYNAYAIAAVTSALSAEGRLWLDELTGYLESNRKEILDFIEKNRLPLKAYMPEAGYLMWLDFRKSGIPKEDIGKIFLEKAGIKLNDGIDHGTYGAGFVRINFGVTKATLQLALNRIKNLVEEEY